MEWTILDQKLVNQFVFANQSELAEFLLQVAIYADSIDHHPDYRVFQCSKVEFTLFTHHKKTVSDLDYKLAEFISQSYNSLRK